MNWSDHVFGAIIAIIVAALVLTVAIVGTNVSKDVTQHTGSKAKSKIDDILK